MRLAKTINIDTEAAVVSTVRERRRLRNATSRLVFIYINLYERDNPQQETAQPQKEDILELGEDLP